MAQNNNPLQYMGTEASNPPNIIFSHRRPINPHDWRNVNVGDFWVVKAPHELWYLASLANNGSQVNPMATWLRIYPRGDAIEQFIADTGVANEENGVLNILGGANVNTVGAAATVTINLDDTISLTGGLNVAGTVTFSGIIDGVVQGDANGDLSASRGTDGQLLIGRTGANPTWGSITSTDTTVVITEGPGALDLTLSAGGVGGAEQFNTDSGVAHELNQVIAMRGDGNIETSGSTNTITIEAGQINKTLSVDGTITFDSLTDGVLQGDIDGIVSTSRGTDGQLLIGKESGLIEWNTLSSADNSVTITNGPGTINIAAVGGGGGKGEYIFSSYKSFTSDFPAADLGTSISFLGPYICDTALVNDGNHYDTATGIYTVPQDGYYIFNASVSAIIYGSGHETNVTHYEMDYKCYLNVSGVRYLLDNTSDRAPNGFLKFISTRASLPLVGSSIIMRVFKDDIIFPEIGYMSMRYNKYQPASSKVFGPTPYGVPGFFYKNSYVTYFSGYMLHP